MMCCNCLDWGGKVDSIPPCTKNAKQYQLISCIGEGSYGRVHLAVWKHYDEERDYFKWKISAIKTVSKRRIVEKGYIMKIEYERLALERLSSTSPFIVGFMGAYQNVDHLFFILEFCPGGNLGELLSRHRNNESGGGSSSGGGGFSESSVRFYLSQVLCALNHIHENGVIYRDLKPENIVLDARGHVRLVDFGLAHVGRFNLPSDDNNGGKNNYYGGRAFTICGSDEYIAPEVLLKLDIGYDWSCDIWSFGCLLFELLIGYPAYEAPTRPERFLKITTQNGYLTGSNFNYNQSINSHLKIYQKFQQQQNNSSGGGSSGYGEGIKNFFSAFSNSQNDINGSDDQISTMVAFDKLSEHCKDFISKLLIVNPRRRLGTCLEGWKEIQQDDIDKATTTTDMRRNGQNHGSSLETIQNDDYDSASSLRDENILENSTGIRKSARVTMKLIKDEKLRLSYGIHELRNHPFWNQEIKSWDPYELIKNGKSPPYIPFPCKNNNHSDKNTEIYDDDDDSFFEKDFTLLDTRYFSDRFTNQKPRLPPLGHPHKGGPTPRFEGFNHMPSDELDEDSD